MCHLTFIYIFYSQLLTADNYTPIAKILYMHFTVIYKQPIYPLKIQENALHV